MKRIISFAAALSMIFGAASCQKELTPGKEGDCKVTFSVEIPDNVVTKAEMSDGTTIDELLYEVYVGDDVMYEGSISPTTAGSRQFVLELNLVTGQTYDLLFWAQKKETGYYETHSLKNIRAHYPRDNKFGNDEKRDAFCGARTGFKASGIATSETIKLYRPFAQINFGSSPNDWAKAEPFIRNGGLKSQVTVTQVPTYFNVFTGDIIPIYEDITFDYALAPASEDTYTNDHISYNGSQYGWIAMNYIFGSKSESVISTVTASFIHDKNDVNSALEKEVINVPYKQNYRTNILGEIFTGGNKFTVVIEPGFANDPIENYPDYILAEPIFFAFENGGTVTLSEDVTLPSNIRTNKDVTINLNGHTINYRAYNGESESLIMARIEKGGRLTINGPGAINSNGYIASANEGSKIFVNGGDFKAYTTAFQSNGGEVYLLGGTYEENSVPAEPKYLVNYIDSQVGKGTISISGGTFKGFNPSDNNAENPQVDFTAIGYQTVDNQDGTYTVVEKERGSVSLPADTNIMTATTIKANKIEGNGSSKIYADFTNTTSQYIIDFQDGQFYDKVSLYGSNTRNTDGKVTRGVFISNITASSTLYFKAVSIEGVGYTINTGSNINPDANFKLTSGNLQGWTSIASFKSATFRDVRFKIGTYFTDFDEPSWNGCLRAGTTTVVDECTFEKDFYISLETLPEGATITFKKCKVNGVLLTAENVAEYLNETEEGTLAKIIFENN